MNDKFFAASIDVDITTIDLHETQNIPDALDKLEQELFLLYKKDTQYCRVVHGIGTGALASAVHDALEKNPMVGAWKIEESGGACVVVF